jgi:hypothetical protein
MMESLREGEGKPLANDKKLIESEKGENCEG